MSQTDYETAIAHFLRTKNVTRCSTVCAVPTQATVAEADRAAYRDYVAAKEASAARAPEVAAAPGPLLVAVADVR